MVAAEGDRFGELTAGQVLGRSVVDVFLDEPLLARAAQRALAGQRARHRVVVQGNVFEVRFEPRHGEGGRITGQIVLALDVTHRVRREAEIREREGQMRLLFQQMPGIIWATDRNLRITYTGGRKASGPVDGLFVGKTIQELAGTADPTEPLIAHHLAALSGARTAFRYQDQRSGRWLEMLLEPLLDAEGRIAGCIGAAVDVTERKQAEERLARSESLLAESQRIAHVGSWEWDIERNAVTWSDEMYRIYGLEKAAFGGSYESFLEHVHRDDQEHVKTVLFTALRNLQPFVYDHRIVRPDGCVRMLHTRGAVFVDDNRKPVRMAGSCWDVTDRWEAMRRLEQAVSLREATLESTADGLLVVDLAGKIVACNQRFLALWRIPQALAASGDDEALLSFVQEQLEDSDAFMRGVRELYGRPETESFDVLRFHDGRVYERLSKPQRVGGAIAGRVWSFRDVTERERLLRRALFLADAGRLLASLDAEKALEAVARLTIPILGGACAIDLFGNGTPRRLLAISRDPAHPISSEVPPAIFDGHSLTYTADALSHIAVPIAVRGRVAGAITFAADLGHRYTPADLELAEDLASRAALALENSRLYRSAEEAVQVRDEFLSIAAHEIRGPLTSMRLAVQSLRSGQTHAPRKLLDIIEREDRRLTRLVEDFTEMGHIRAGRLHLDLEEVDLAAVVRDVASQLAPDLARSGSSLSITTDGKVMGTWDRSRLDRVVTDLLSNSIKFGLGKPIEIATRSQQGKAILVIKDQGIGIPTEMHEKIFEPFERAAPPRQYGGLGLGLYIARTLVTGLGGTIRIESAPGGGATFTVELPQAR